MIGISSARGDSKSSISSHSTITTSTVTVSVEMLSNSGVGVNNSGNATDSNHIFDNQQDVTPVVAFDAEMSREEIGGAQIMRPTPISTEFISDTEDRRRRARSIQNLENHLEDALVHDEDAERLELMMKLRPTLAEEFMKQASVIDLYLLGNVP